MGAQGRLQGQVKGAVLRTQGAVQLVEGGHGGDGVFWMLMDKFHEMKDLAGAPFGALRSI